MQDGRPKKCLARVARESTRCKGGVAHGHAEAVMSSVLPLCPACIARGRAVMRRCTGAHVGHDMLLTCVRWPPGDIRSSRGGNTTRAPCSGSPVSGRDAHPATRRRAPAPGLRACLLVAGSQGGCTKIRVITAIASACVVTARCSGYDNHRKTALGAVGCGSTTQRINSFI